MTAAPGVRPGTRPTRSRERLGALGTRGAPILVLALAALLGTYQLGRKSLWHDEAFTLAVARGDGDAFRSSIAGQEAFAALYYGVIRLVPLGEGEAALRVPSVLSAALAAAAGYALARRLFGTRVAVVAAALLTTNVYFVRYAQEARAYALALCLVTVAGWALVRAVQRPTWPSWLAFGAVSAAAAYAHLFALFVLTGQLLSLLALRTAVPWRRVAGAVGLAATLVLPLTVVLLRNSAGGRPFLAQTSPLALARDLAGLVPSSLGVLQGLAVAVGAAAAVLTFARAGRDGVDPVRRWGYWLLAGWLAVPVALAALVSTFWPVFVTRYFLVCIPAVVLMVAVGVAAIPRVFSVALLLVMLLAAAQGLHRYYLPSHKEGEDWRGLVNHVAAEAAPGDSVVFLSHLGRQPFEYYLARHPDLASTLTPAYPSLPWYRYPPVVGETLLDPAGDRARLSAAEPVRVWAVLLWGGFRTDHDDGAAIARTLDRRYRRAEQRSYGRYLKLERFDRVEEAAVGVIGAQVAPPLPVPDRETGRIAAPRVRTHLTHAPAMEEQPWIAARWSPGGPASWDPTSAIDSSTRATRSPAWTTS